VAGIVRATRCKALSITFVDGLSEHIGAAIVSVVIRAVAIYPIAAGSHVNCRLYIVIGAAGDPPVMVIDNRSVPPRPFGLTLPFHLDPLLVDFRLLLVCLFFLFPVVIAVALSTSRHIGSKKGEQPQSNDRR